jgi:hypothetical protein
MKVAGMCKCCFDDRILMSLWFVCSCREAL